MWSEGDEDVTYRPGERDQPPCVIPLTWRPGKYSFKGANGNPHDFNVQPQQIREIARDQRQQDARNYLNRTPAGVKVPLWGRVDVDGRTYWHATEAAWVGGEEAQVNFDRDHDFVRTARRTMRNGRIVTVDENGQEADLGGKVTMCRLVYMCISMCTYMYMMGRHM